MAAYCQQVKLFGYGLGGFVSTDGGRMRFMVLPRWGIRRIIAATVRALYRAKGEGGNDAVTDNQLRPIRGHAEGMAF